MKLFRNIWVNKMDYFLPVFFIAYLFGFISAYLAFKIMALKVVKNPILLQIF